VEGVEMQTDTTSDHDDDYFDEDAPTIVLIVDRKRVDEAIADAKAEADDWQAFEDLDTEAFFAIGTR
jgi:hypothetical protein